jgi:hypothetical protein
VFEVHARQAAVQGRAVHKFEEVAARFGHFFRLGGRGSKLHVAAKLHDDAAGLGGRGQRQPE